MKKAPRVPLSIGERVQILRERGFHDSAATELIPYTDRACDSVPCLRLPLPDEAFVEAWQEYITTARDIGVARTLSRTLVQLRFPIQAGISRTARYVAATRRGVMPDEDRGPAFHRPHELEMFLHTTPAGRLPVLWLGDRRDFERVVQAVTRHNEPVRIPMSQGASFVSGYNNWDRIARLRTTRTDGDADSQMSLGTFRERYRGREGAYRDRFVVMGDGPYSGVDGRSFGMDADAWLDTSFTIRLEHECAHYFTRRALGFVRTNILDELLADYMGITAALGCYRMEWGLGLIGVDRSGGIRSDARIRNYAPDPGTSEAELGLLSGMVVEAAAVLEEVDHGLARGGEGRHDRIRVLIAASSMSSEEFVANAAARRLQIGLRQARLHVHFEETSRSGSDREPRLRRAISR